MFSLAKRNLLGPSNWPKPEITSRRRRTPSGKGPERRSPSWLRYGTMTGMMAIPAVTAAIAISAPMTPYSVAVVPSLLRNSLARTVSIERSINDKRRPYGCFGQMNAFLPDKVK
jgi:hypothetical protein